MDTLKPYKKIAVIGCNGCAKVCMTGGDEEVAEMSDLGVMKYQEINEDLVVLKAKPPSDKKIQSLKKLLEDLGLPVTVH